MNPTLTSHPKWSPSLKRFYNKYHSSIKLIDFTWHESFRLPIEWDSEYRVRRSFGKIKDGNWTREITLYTNNLDLIDFLITEPYYAFHIDYMSTPIDQDHLDALQSDFGNVIFRSSPFYKKYYYRVISGLRWGEIPDQEKVESAVKFIKENFTDYKITYPSGRNYLIRNSWQTLYAARVYSPGSVKYTKSPKFPCLYTNDEATLMLLKMGYDSDFNLQISKVYVTDKY